MAKPNDKVDDKAADSNSPFIRDAIFQGLSRSVLISVCDDQGRIVYCNEKFAETSGYAKQELLGQDHKKLNSSFHGKKFFEKLWTTIKSGETWTGEIRNLSKNKEVYWVSSSIYPFHSNGETIYVSISTDITEQKISDELYMETSNILSEISRGSPICFYQFEHKPDGTLQFNYISESAEKFFHISQKEVYEDINRFFSCVHPEDLMWVNKELRDAALMVKSWKGDFRLKPPSGEVTWIECSVIPQRQKNGSVLLHGTIFDITGRKNLEKELVNQARLALLGEMASGIAHEINNPLTVIMAKAETLQAKMSQTPLTRENLEPDVAKLAQMSQRVTKIIRGLKVISRDGGQDPFEKASISAIIKDTVSLAIERFRQADVQLIDDCGMDAEIECRPTQVSQIILNLLNNACDAVEPLPERWVRIDSELTAARQVRVSVTDSGSGIPKEIAEKLMEPFFTTKANGKGTGLGLSISNGIAEDHGGSLTLDQNSKNTRFVLDLPTQNPKTSYGSLVIR